MTAIRLLPLLASLTVVAAGCTSSPTALSTTDSLRSDGAQPPVDARSAHAAMKEARFQAALEGVDFDDGLVVVTAPMALTSRRAAEAQLAEGLDRLETNQRTEAAAAFTLAIRNDPAWADGYRGLGRTLVSKGKLDMALAAYRTVERLDGDDVEAGYEIAALLDRMGQRDAAIDRMLVVVEQDPAYAAAHERLAIWSYYQQDLDAARQHAATAEALGRQLPPQFIALLNAE